MTTTTTTDRCNRNSGRSASSPAAPGLRKGSAISVYRVNPRTGPFIEGRGVIERACRRLHYFYVRFDGEKVCRVRFVHPDWQQDPDRCLALLRAFWKASLEPPVIGEFFPSSTPKGGVP
ncbi:MAG TPA: hypothetical protein VHW66_22125 [Stellaceae bacterium]|jgi:hypothetical protein|nr:hypothetical protein [Stellaceae bacterium]